MSLSGEFMRPEDQLLVSCARSTLDARHTEQIQGLLQDRTDWSNLLKRASHHGVLPLLYRSLQTTAPDVIPPASFGQLQNAYRQNIVRNEFLARELVRLLMLFTEHDILAIPFKGPALAVLAYGHLSLRQFGDLDLFVPKRDLPRAIELLLSQGYRPTNQPNSAHPREPLERKYHTFIGKDEMVSVDLQFMMAGNHFSFQLDHEDWQSHLAPVSVAGTSLMTFSPEVMLLILCVHGSKHRWARLQWVCDVAELLRAHPRMDWGRLIDLSRRLGSQRMLTLGIRLAHDLIGTNLSPEELGNLPPDKVAASLVKQLRPQLFPDGESHQNSGDPSAFYLKLRERWWDKVKYVMYLCVARKPVAKAQGSWPLPGSLTFLYVLLWPFLKVGKYGLRSKRINNELSQWLERMG